MMEPEEIGMSETAEILMNRIQAKVLSTPMGAYKDALARKQELGDDFVRDPASESIILDDWRYASQYAKNVIQAPWTEFEEAIAAAEPEEDPRAIRAIYNYVKDVKGDHLEAAEKHVANDAETAVDYSIEILGRPWDEGQKAHRAATTMDADQADRYAHWHGNRTPGHSR
jgi:hypothetical protein